MSEFALQVYTMQEEGDQWFHLNANSKIEKSVYDEAVRAFANSLQMRLVDPDMGRWIDADWCAYINMMSGLVVVFGTPLAYSLTDEPFSCLVPLVGGVGVMASLSIYEGHLSNREEEKLRGAGGKEFFLKARKDKIRELLTACNAESAKFSRLGVSWARGNVLKPAFEIPVWALQQ